MGLDTRFKVIGHLSKDHPDGKDIEFVSLR